MVKSCTVYMNGDDFYKTMDFRTLSDLKSLGRDLKQKWMYKGYHYYGGEKIITVVFTQTPFTSHELLRRKGNGLLNVRTYYLNIGIDYIVCDTCAEKMKNEVYYLPNSINNYCSHKCLLDSINPAVSSLEYRLKGWR